MARVIRVESPPRRYVLLRAGDGDFLGTDGGGTLVKDEQADDNAVWVRGDDGRDCRHVVTGLTLACDADTVTVDGESFAVDRGPDRLPSHYLREFVANGWVCLAALLGSEAVAALQAIAVDGDWPRTADDHTRAPLNRSAVVAQVAAEPVSLWLTRHYLRTQDVCLAHAPSLAVRDEDDGESDVQGWHTDFPYLWGSPPSVGGDRVPTVGSGDLVLGVQRNVCVTDFTLANGATCFKLGSHRRNVAPPRPWGVDADYARPGYRRANGLPYDGPEADVIEAPAGSVILYDARTWHRAGVNRTARRRAALLQAMTPTYVMPFKDTAAPYRVLRDSALMASLTERERREIRRLMVREIVGPLGRHAIAIDPSLAGQD